MWVARCGRAGGITGVGVGSRQQGQKRWSRWVSIPLPHAWRSALSTLVARAGISSGGRCRGLQGDRGRWEGGRCLTCTPARLDEQDWACSREGRRERASERAREGGSLPEIAPPDPLALPKFEQGRAAACESPAGNAGSLRAGPLSLCAPVCLSGQAAASPHSEPICPSFLSLSGRRRTAPRAFLIFRAMAARRRLAARRCLAAPAQPTWECLAASHTGASHVLNP